MYLKNSQKANVVIVIVNKQIFQAFLFNIRNYSRVNNFDIKQNKP